MKYLLRALPVLVLAAAAAFGINSATAGPPPPVGNCANVTAGVLSPDSSGGNVSQYIDPTAPTVTAVTSTKGTWSAGCVSWLYLFYRGATQVQALSSNSYTPTTSDENSAITVQVQGCDVNDSCVNQLSTGTANVLGSSLVADEFNTGAGTQPCSAVEASDGTGSQDLDSDGDTASSDTDSACTSGAQLWDYNTGLSGGINYQAASAGETSTGYLEIQASKVGSNWYSAGITSHNSYSGERYVEARIKVDCYTSQYADAAAFETTPASPNDNLEVDLNEQYAGSTIAQLNMHQSSVQHFNAQNEWHTAEATHMDNDYNEATGDTDWQTDTETPADETTSTQVCGNWHTYGMAVYATKIVFYYDGTAVHTVNKSDCPFKDPDGDNATGSGGDSDCTTDTDSDSDGIQNFTSYSQQFHFWIFSHDDSVACPTDEADGGVTDNDDPGQPGQCTQDPDNAGNDNDGDNNKDIIGGAGPVTYYIDYIHINNLTG